MTNQMTRTALWRPIFLALTLSITAACASSGSGARTDRNLITEPELQQVPERMTALEAVQRLRPQWLQGRGPVSFNAGESVVIYLNRQRTAFDVFERMAVAEIRELRFLDSMAATQQFGTGHTSGAILIISR
jgi:hypothetical protein